MAAEEGKNNRAVWGVVLALLALLLAACASETTSVPQPAPEATVIPAPAPTTSSIATPEPTATAIPAPDTTANLTVAPTRISTIQPTPLPTPDSRETIKSEVAAAVSQFGQALSTADTDLMASFTRKNYVIGGDQMSKTLKKLTILTVLTIAVVGSILGGLSTTSNAQSDDEDALRAEVEAAARQLGEARNTSDGELFDTLWLQSDKTTYFPPFQRFRVDGWSKVRQPFSGLLDLPPGAVNVVVRQEHIDLVADDVAIRTGIFIFRIRPPGGTTRTINGIFSRVLQKVDGKWINVHGNTSTLP